MRSVWVIAAAVSLLLAAAPAVAQLPTATGRQISMSNAAWKIFIPSEYVPRAGNVADVLVHFHGDPQTYWNNAKYADLNSIIVTVNYSGLSSAYSGPFSNSSLFGSLLTEALGKVRLESGFSSTLQWDKVGVSSFSAGYGAVREILKSQTYRDDIDALLAADSLYASTAGDGTPLDSQMTDYKTYATAAKNGTKTFLFSHSQVPTFTYESTMETGDELMQHLNIGTTLVNTNGLGTLNFYRTAQSGKFRLWGATGADGDSHLEHLRYIGEFLKEMPLAKVTAALVPVAGDYTADGSVDAADYVVWRHTNGSTTNMAANGDNTIRSFNVINELDYVFWKKVFAAGTGGGSVVGNPIPEPASWILGIGLVLLRPCHRGRGRPGSLVVSSRAGA